MMTIIIFMSVLIPRECIYNYNVVHHISKGNIIYHRLYLIKLILGVYENQYVLIITNTIQLYLEYAYTNDYRNLSLCLNRQGLIMFKVHCILVLYHFFIIVCTLYSVY